MKQRPASDPFSLRYQAAIHGRNGEQNRQNPDWDWCQHQNWFFLPWHRMYLRQFERIIGHLIGKPNWRIPYWDYSGGDQSTWALPPEFLTPANENNPLWVSGRARNVLTQEQRDAERGLDPRFFSSGGELQFGFGSGRLQSPSQFGGATGTIEQWPHNVIHMAVGGLMGNPVTAALDPLFWLHHANVDRLWGVWLASPGGHVNPRRAAWLDTSFSFPTPGASGAHATFRVRDVLETSALGYAYDDPATARDEASLLADEGDEPEPPEPELVGATTGVRMDPGSSVQIDLEVPTGPGLLGDEEGGEARDVFLQLEGIKGVDVTVGIYGVYVDVPEGEAATDHPELKAGLLATFGLELATESGHSVTQAFKITDIARRLEAEGRWDPASLRVSFEEEDPVEEGADASHQEVTVERISVFYS
ncbi:MAG: tyrosinase family protein [Actinomycetota bacterium]|nr:tyrosinase family protein [Actinomycetota bacterium]